ncbi:putative phosphatidylinositolglycan class N [Aureobasidium subglaciale]|nr:putative phosphatidylinositolglycan class N [Aureobasidium subglaciale]
MARMGRLGFLAVAVAFHLIYAYSIFDIYFVSPIVSGMREYSVTHAEEAPAERLVLFVGDGLRADKAFQYFPDPSPGAEQEAGWQEPRPLAPFLRSRVLEHGTFGVSHTRVPTESRPGHVALIAGLYEDVSAVTTGWKLNPVHFDSVFNRSRHTWSWGSPDILPMFQEGAVPGRVDAFMYGAEEEDFSKDATHLDTWVFERVEELFASASQDSDLNARLRQDKNVFFLHLLGLDTTGHSYRPYSREYLHNIKVVDQGVEKITALIDNFYADDKTAYVFTADHGMSDWGSHGDGHPDNTRTPLIAWGSGVAKPVTVSSGLAPGHDDDFSSDWHLDHVQRNDVAQADIATLMAYLAGLPFPVNSVGELPLAFLSADQQTKAQAMLVNAQEILEMYRIKEHQKKNTVLRYKPFPGFSDDQNSPDHRVEAIMNTIDQGRHEQAIKDSDALMKMALQGLRYLQTYDWLFLRALVTLGYLGWMAFAFTFALDQHVFDGKVDATRSTATTTVFSSIFIALLAFLIVQSSPWTYYAYAFFPVMFWEEVFARRQALFKAKNLFSQKLSGTDILGLGVSLLVYVGILEIMVQSYYRREMYTLCYLLAIVWPASYGLEFVRQNWIISATWALACVSMSIFTVLPANKVEDVNLILLGGLLMLLAGILYIAFEKSLLVQATSSKGGLTAPKTDQVSRILTGVQIGLIALAMIVTRSSATSLQAKTGLPLGAQVTGWIVLVSSLILPFAHSYSPNNHYLHRIVVVFLAFAPMFVILTISYEGLFYLAFSCTLITWVRLEHRIYRAFTTKSSLSSPTGAASETVLEKHEYRSLTLADARIALFFLYLLQSAFFSTGNIASISSFSLDAVSRLIPVFDPFSQGALLILKILAPFALVSANLGLLTRRLRLKSGALFALVIAIGDWLTLRFFWSVRDEGSWLEIGESISVFVIASALCVFVAGLEMVSEAFVRGIEFDDEVERAPSSNGKINGVKAE